MNEKPFEQRRKSSTTLVVPSIKTDRSTGKDEEKNCEGKRGSARIVAILMVTLGSLLALAFILIGLGKAVEHQQNHPSVDDHHPTKLIIVSNASILSKLLLKEMTMTISSTAI
ncbi:hypothetical protein G6F46_009158 [Rhizopus delemar]|uniref:Uncharacterized protein n=3 Tax=Rhizopus TaxID=4842 RepID=I1CPG3_RHIO9|nr:hypothetical protein RO3G_15054 [Rhizopus delemar RA 99-880]KAG1442822.1 hypothetical protein G6F55_012856 [Rhizopus delemar]KAG1534487.1 hypothetical protein G6F51_012073 [Rhizopus arrhizus]KAG1493431.1 hypothetical protein G6F52_013253 [Rhizopus delemar]KAG1498292.1 hypothetical protein G6F54_005179 [Rhizopus delemar]|eukprot:EIE90343.1 hypothetical protein RO3G_15054 [Rhizopus delemar RA 99-880]